MGFVPIYHCVINFPFELVIKSIVIACLSLSTESLRESHIKKILLRAGPFVTDVFLGEAFECTPNIIFRNA